eukprot:CAMPEP_0183459008 /NCGR_PEP_ID=MMETSP0370-20130417/134685_1 /TAXON_ID=268820 /ORGANISM="Peridinium aciculiferum, Strain PAER-2" /LENGTH=55 /DNA_ID=CAMNT_0025650821 /DNA_START=222 /DNA_END=386 /DNA_ORIENTATION=-
MWKLAYSCRHFHDIAKLIDAPAALARSRAGRRRGIAALALRRLALLRQLVSGPAP